MTRRLRRRAPTARCSSRSTDAAGDQRPEAARLGQAAAVRREDQAAEATAAGQAKQQTQQLSAQGVPPDQAQQQAQRRRQQAEPAAAEARHRRRRPSSRSSSSTPRRPTRGCRRSRRHAEDRRREVGLASRWSTRDGHGRRLHADLQHRALGRATEDLVDTLRDDVIPEGHQGQGHDRPRRRHHRRLHRPRQRRSPSKLPLVIGDRARAVVRPAAARLPLAARSRSRPSIMNLLSIGAAFGIVTLRVRPRLVGAARRARRHGADRLVRPADDVRDPVRALDGLRGVPDDARPRALQGRRATRTRR